MRKLFIFLSVIIIYASVSAQDAEPYVTKGFVIARSTKDYAAAKQTAEQASKKLNLKLDLRELKPHKKNGLTYSKKDCENEGGYPCYISRGRYDDGDYVSIEWSNAFDGFTKGYYIVILASGNKEDINSTLTKAKKFYKDAYVKQTSVYIGCMH